MPEEYETELNTLIDKGCIQGWDIPLSELEEYSKENKKKHCRTIIHEYPYEY